MPTLLTMDGLYLYTSSVKIFLVNLFSRLQKISKHVPLCTRTPRIRKCFHPQQNYDVTPNWRIRVNLIAYVSNLLRLVIYNPRFNTSERGHHPTNPYLPTVPHHAGQSRISTSLICPARIAGIGRMSRIEPIDLKYLHDIQKI